MLDRVLMHRTSLPATSARDCSQQIRANASFNLHRTSPGLSYLIVFAPHVFYALGLAESRAHTFGTRAVPWSDAGISRRMPQSLPLSARTRSGREGAFRTLSLFCSGRRVSDVRWLDRSCARRRRTDRRRRRALTTRPRCAPVARAVGNERLVRGANLLPRRGKAFPSDGPRRWRR